MKNIFVLFFFSLSAVGFLQAQAPASCFEIESILVDACGTPEGENEMVRFRVGPNPLNVSSLSVNWPNNSWLGVCQTPATAAKVAQLNATITQCGWLLEPVGGVLPAGATVLLVTSTNFSVAANSFANLSDTLYIIFQCQGNTTGHFANATGSGSRTLTMTFGAGCNDAVTYDCQLLIDINGNTGTSSPTTDRDGATANFTWGGTDTYTNTGCNAPFVPQTVNAGSDDAFCQGDTIFLNGTVSGAFTSVQWTGGSGTWINANTEDAQYVVGVGDMGTITLTLSGINCTGSISDQVSFVISPLPVLTMSPSGALSICAGDVVTLTAGGGGPYSWSTGSTATSINVSSPGTYTVSKTNACGTVTRTATVTVGGIPVAAITPNGALVVCQGSTLQLTASGGVNYLWSTSETTSVINVNTGGTYTVIVSNGCGSDTTSVTVTSSPMPDVNILNGNAVTICQGTTVNLVATGIGDIDWVNVSSDSIINISQAGTYLAFASNGCGYDSASVVVTVDPLPAIQLDPVFILCKGETENMNPVYTGQVTWYDGNTNPTRSISAAGNYFVVASNSCGSDTAFFTVLTSQVAAGFTADSMSGQAPLWVNFTNQSVFSDTYQWDFGDGGSSADKDPAYTFLHPGNHLVILTALDSNGCADTASMWIDVDACDNKVFIPNAFTPNLDNINPEFKVVSNCALRSTITIFDRWGKEIISWTDLSKGWNGNNRSGDPLPIGTYTYLFEFEDANGEDHSYRGMVNLLR